MGWLAIILLVHMAATISSSYVLRNVNLLENNNDRAPY